MSLRKPIVPLPFSVLGPPGQGWQASLSPPLKEKDFCAPLSPKCSRSSVHLGQGLRSCGCAADHDVLSTKENITGEKKNGLCSVRGACCLLRQPTWASFSTCLHDTGMSTFGITRDCPLSPRRQGRVPLTPHLSC